MSFNKRHKMSNENGEIFFFYISSEQKNIVWMNIR